MRLLQNNTSKKKLAYILFAFGIISIAVMYLLWDFLFHNKLFGLKLLDLYDIDVYFRSSRWVVGEGILYKNIFSQYTLLANLIFGFSRFVAEATHPFSSDLESFSFIWASISWLIYLVAIYLTLTHVSKNSIWLWLTPAAVYFAIFRFDIYTSLTTLLALLAIRDEKYTKGSFWLGITIALKGYALFLLPSYLIFIFYKQGIKGVIKATIVSLFPFVLGNLIVFLYAGLKGLLVPYSFHAARQLNGESTYDVFYLNWLVALFPKLPTLLEISSSLLPVLKKPKTFESLINAFLIALVGFMTFSVFYSPQFFLWIVPIACFSTSILIKRLTIAFCWATFFYYPIGWGIKNKGLFGKIFLRAAMTVTAVTRLALLYNLVRRGKKTDQPSLS
ncbi:hypothetical protein NIES25_53040 [Nostoc linckia NIES-25]|nr:hypothetical protein NIES25_53040 [Nostoc linckia NIES-25]